MRAQVGWRLGTVGLFASLAAMLVLLFVGGRGDGPFTVPPPVRLRASIGIALCAPGELDADRLLHHADLAMYRAKAAGREIGSTSFAHYDAALLS